MSEEQVNNQENQAEDALNPEQRILPRDASALDRAKMAGQICKKAKMVV